MNEYELLPEFITSELSDSSPLEKPTSTLAEVRTFPLFY